MSFPIKAGGTNTDWGRSITPLSDGSSIVTGRFEGSATFGSITLTSAASSDIFVAKLNAYGNYVWATKAGSPSNIAAFGISSLGDGSSIVTGTFAGSATFGSTTLTSSGDDDIFIAKLNADGSYAWAKQAGGTGSEIGYGISSLSDGSSIVTGEFEGSATFGSITLTSAGSSDVFVAKLNSDGSYAWATKAGSPGSDYGKGISTLSDGSSIVSGTFAGSVTFGSTNLTSSGSRDFFVAKLDANGNYLWATSAGGSGDDEGVAGISTLSDGSSIVTGEFSGSATFGSTTLTSAGDDDIFVAKLDTNGNYLWATSAGGSAGDEPGEISTLSDGSSIVTGEFEGSAAFGTTTLTSTGDDDIFVAKLDTNGNYLWATSAGGIGEDEGEGISTLSDGSSIVTGEFEGSAAFGTTTLTGSGKSDIFVAKLDSTGNWTSATPTPTPSPTPTPTPTPTPSPIQTPSPEPTPIPESFQTVDGFTQFTDVADSLLGQSNIKYRMMGGNDLLEVTGGIDNFANGNRGEDKIILSGGQGRYLGGSDNDIFEVFAAEDGTSVNGNRGDDTIIGSVSGVIYRGGKDNDTLAVSQGEAWGDLGADVFRGVTGEGYAVIQDYTIGEDIVELEMAGVWSQIESGLMFTDDSGDQIMLLVGIDNVDQVTLA